MGNRLTIRIILAMGFALSVGCGKFSTADHSGEPGPHRSFRPQGEGPAKETQTEVPAEPARTQPGAVEEEPATPPTPEPVVTQEPPAKNETLADDKGAEPAPQTTATPAPEQTQATPQAEKPAGKTAEKLAEKPAEKPVAEKPVVKPTPKPVVNKPEPEEEKPSNSILFTKIPLEESEIAESGYISPTIYDFPILNEDKGLCSNSSSELLGSKGNVLLTVCQKTLEICGEEGSCAIIKDGVTHSLNVLTRVNGKDHFFEIGNDCPFGYGVQNICLDPFFTLAADLKIYKPGDIIYIPGVSGMTLPNGAKHDGYFVVRDEGRGVKGKGRFDFFSGYFRWSHPQNPFGKLGLGSINTKIPYYKIKGKRADAIRASRGFPRLPAKPIRNMPAT